MNHICQSIETAWDNLLETIQESAATVRQNNVTGATEIATKLDTLHVALRGLGLAWKEIRDLMPAEQIEDAEIPDVAGALPESAYWKPLAKVLLARGGIAAARDAIADVEKAMGARLNPLDRGPLPGSGQIRWIIRVRFACNTLKNHGLISRRAPHGQWELTEAGKRWAESDADNLIGPVEEPDPNQIRFPF